MFWTRLSYQWSIIHLNICPGSAWVPTRWQDPSHPSMSGCSPTVPQEAETKQDGPWPWCAHVLAIGRRSCGDKTSARIGSESCIIRNRHSPKLAQERNKGGHHGFHVAMTISCWSHWDFWERNRHSGFNYEFVYSFAVLIF